MSRVLLSLGNLLLATIAINCGSSPQLEGVTLGDIQIEGDHAEDVQADLEKALDGLLETPSQPSAAPLQKTSAASTPDMSKQLSPK